MAPKMTLIFESLFRTRRKGAKQIVIAFAPRATAEILRMEGRKGAADGWQIGAAHAITV